MPSVLRRGQPNPAHQTPVACAYSIRHGYSRSHGVHISRMPPLCIRGIQNFAYASDHYSSYELFPSSALAPRVSPRAGGGQGGGGALGFSLGAGGHLPPPPI
jgi:hypothetical protein